MTPSAGDGPRMTLPQSDFEALLERAAEKGVRRALADVGLDGDHAAEDVHDLRSLLAALRLVRTTAIQTAVRMIVAGVLMVLVASRTVPERVARCIAQNKSSGLAAAGAARAAAPGFQRTALSRRRERRTEPRQRQHEERGAEPRHRGELGPDRRA